MDEPSPASDSFNYADYATYLSAVVAAIAELNDQDHSPGSFLGAVLRTLEYQVGIADRATVEISGDSYTTSLERVSLFHQRVMQQVFRRLNQEP